MLNFPFVAVSLVSFTDTFIALKSTIKVLFLRNFLQAVRLSHRKQNWVICMLNFTQPAFNTLAALSGLKICRLSPKMSPGFVTSTLCRKLLFSAIELNQLVWWQLCLLSHKQFNANLLFQVMLQNKANKENNLKEPKVIFSLDSSMAVLPGGHY